MAAISLAYINAPILDDAYLLDLADAANADFLITGDHRSGMLQREHIGRASILTAKAFVSQLAV